MKAVASPLHLAAGLTELWSPRVIAEVNDAYVKVAKVQGELAAHRHEHEDELFLVLKGAFRLELESGPVDLTAGDMFVVPRNTLHRPVAPEECLLLLLEPKTTQHTGDLVTERTRSMEEQLRPL